MAECVAALAILALSLALVVGDAIAAFWLASFFVLALGAGVLIISVLEARRKGK